MLIADQVACSLLGQADEQVAMQAARVAMHQNLEN
jgi:hypothetical protein